MKPLRAASGKFSIKVEKLVYGADALSFQDGFAVFTPLAVPGDEIEAEWMGKSKSFGRARVTKVLKPSPWRVKAPCPLFPTNRATYTGCGGCQWQMIDYKKQLQAKREALSEALTRIGKFPPQSLSVEDCVGLDNPWNFRNKAQYPLKRIPGDRLLIGYFETETHRIVDVNDCAIELKLFQEPMKRMRAILSDPKWSIYEETTHSGLIKHLCFRGSERTGEILLTLVSREPIPDNLAAVLEGLRFPGLVGMVENVNPLKTNFIYGQQGRVFWGNPYYHEKILGKTFRISSTSFFQTNTEQAEKIASHILNWAPEKMKIAIDAYCGAGLFTLFLADRAEKVIGIEEAESSLKDAAVNQKENGVNNIEWRKGSTEDLLKETEARADLLVVDPPRQGLKEEALAAILEKKPIRVAYVSCDPATLSRDLRKLVDGGYTLEKVIPFDLFPHSYHVETLALLKLN